MIATYVVGGVLVENFHRETQSTISGHRFLRSGWLSLVTSIREYHLSSIKNLHEIKRYYGTSDLYDQNEMYKCTMLLTRKTMEHFLPTT